MNGNLAKVSPKVREHIEKEVLPRYEKLSGHTVDHINYVIRRSLKFAEEVLEVNFDMVYVIAAGFCGRYLYVLSFSCGVL